MSDWQIVFPWLVPMLVLSLLSALFSGSEAALFSLREKDLRSLKRRGASGRAVVALISRPERLLSGILFWNLMVNMMYFGIAGIVAGRLENGANGSKAAIIFTVASLLFLIFFSEMLPKSIAVLVPQRIALVIAFPMTTAVRIIGPALPLISVINLAIQRLVWPSFTAEPDIDLSDIGRAIEVGTHDAALAQQEQAALRNLVQIADLRIDECMRPRSQLMLVRKPIEIDSFGKQLPPGGYAFVIDEEADEIVGSIALGLMRPSQFDDLDSVIEAVCYVPWSASVSTVLDLLQQQDLSAAVVVNEFGESIGVLTIEDIMRHVLSGRFEHVNLESQQPLETIETGHYRASGAMGLRKIAKQLDITPPEGRTASIAGWMQRINERPPRLGDTCPWDDFQLEVVQESEDGSCVIDIKHIDLVAVEVPRPSSADEVDADSPAKSIPAEPVNDEATR